MMVCTLVTSRSTRVKLCNNMTNFYSKCCKNIENYQYFRWRNCNRLKKNTYSEKKKS